ncbi:MAG: hypothetical protein U1F35_05755 [Steroidobacteraceae bacterium]
MKRALLFACAWLIMTVDAVSAAEGPVPGVLAPASAHRSVKLGRQTVSYTVAWVPTVLRNRDGQPEATISATSYVRDGVADPAARPVLFAFNGGPGASSTPLHFGLLGPRRVTGAAETRKLVDNAQSLIDVADLVLIDPVGTGFSRELHPGGGAAYWSVSGDAASVEQLIRQWLDSHHRGHSPVYIVGESYGGFRAAVLARNIGDLNIGGVILISPGLDFSSISEGSDLLSMFELPSMAVAALAHGKVDARGRTAGEVYEEARSFAQGQLLPALAPGAELDPGVRDRLAERMSQLIGIPAKTLIDARLRLPSQDFLEQLVPGYVVGRIDTRAQAPKPDGPLIPGRDKAADDPALAMGASNIKKSAWAAAYLRDEVGVQADIDYISLTLDVNFKWNWNSGSPRVEDNVGLNPAANLATLVKRAKGSRLLLISGLYDLATPALYQRYAIMHAGIPLDRIEIQTLAAGHTVYEDEDARPLVAARIRSFLEHRPASH